MGLQSESVDFEEKKADGGNSVGEIPSYPRHNQPTNTAGKKNRRREGKLSRNSPNKLIGKKNPEFREKSAKEKIYYVSKTKM